MSDPAHLTEVVKLYRSKIAIIISRQCQREAMASKYLLETNCDVLCRGGRNQFNLDPLRVFVSQEGSRHQGTVHTDQGSDLRNDLLGHMIHHSTRLDKIKTMVLQSFFYLYGSGLGWAVVGTHIDIHQPKGWDYSKEDAFAHAHVSRAQRPKRSPWYILTTTGPIVRKVGM